jgi:hypothetical protein
MHGADTEGIDPKVMKEARVIVAAKRAEKAAAAAQPATTPVDPAQLQQIVDAAVATALAAAQK